MSVVVQLRNVKKKKVWVLCCVFLLVDSHFFSDMVFISEKEVLCCQNNSRGLSKAFHVSSMNKGRLLQISML